MRYRTLAISSFVLLGAMFAVPATIWAVFLPSRAVQNNYETMIGIALLVFGFVGALISVKAFNAEKLNEKYALLGSGFMIMIVSLIFMYKIMELKA